MSKNVKDLFDGLQNAEDLAASKIQVVGKDTTNGIVEDGVDTVIVDGSVSKIGVYGNGTDDITVKGYAGKGTAKSVAGIELSDKAGEVAGATVVLEDGITAKLVAGSKVEFTAEDKKYAPTSVEPKTVVIADSDVVIYDAKVTDAFAGAVMTDTATSKKYKVEVQAITKDACIDVIGGTVTNVYAGGAGATSITENATINISGGKVTNVYAGGTDGAKVIGDVNINVDMNAAATAAAMSIGTIYAGGKNANVLGDVTITVTTNGAVGSNGKIGKIVGAPSGKGVVFGSKNLVLDAYQGDFAASVKGMDTVTILDNSAVTFTKGQDKSMVNAEYIIELSEIDNSNQAAILTLKSDYKLNKLTVSIDSDLITEGGSFSRALIQGVKGKFNSSKFDVNQVNIKKDEGGLIADYQYELSFETVESKGKQVETGKLIFTYTGATLELSVDGYVNRYGVANVLSGADDVVSFGWSYDPINKNYDREIAYNFKTMAGDDVVTIDDKTYFTGKLSLGAGNDTLTINGRLAKLDLSGAGENTVVINGALDARNITTSDDSVNTFIVNGQFAATEVTYAGTVNALNKVVFLYSDGSTTVDSVNSKKKIVSVTQAVYDVASGQWIETVTPWQSNFVVDHFLTSADQNVIAAATQDLTLTKGDNTVVVNNASGIGDITLGGGKAEVVLADAYTGDIDLRKSAESTLIVDDANANFNFKGSRNGANSVIIATDFSSSIAKLDLGLKNAQLTIEQGVTLTIDTAWDKAGFGVEDITFGDNAMLVTTAGSYVYNYSGYWTATANITALGTISDSVINGGNFTVIINDLANSTVNMVNGNAAFGTVADSEISTVTGALTFNGAVANTAISLDGNANVFFFADAQISTFNYGKNNAVINIYNAEVSIDDVVNSEYVVGAGNQKGNITATLDQAALTVAALENATVTMSNNAELNVGDFAGSITASKSTINASGVITANSIALIESVLNIEKDGTVKTLSIDNKSAIEGAGTITVTDNFTITADFTFGADNMKVVMGEKAAVTATAGTVKGDVAKITINGATIAESNIAELNVVAGTIGDAVVAEKSTINAATIADKAVVDLGVVSGAADFVAGQTEDGKDGSVAITADFENGLKVKNGEFTVSSNDDNGVVDVKGEVVVQDATLAGDVRVWNYKAGATPNKIQVVNKVALDGKFEADVNADAVADVTLKEGTEIFRNEDEAFNSLPYGHLDFNAATGDNKLTATAAKVERGVYAKANLKFLGDITADFDVDGQLTLGEAAAENDYVTWEDDTKAAANSTITGKVEAGSIVVDAQAQINGAIVSTGDVTVNADAALAVTEDAAIANLTVAGSVDKAPNGAAAKAAAKATFNGNVTAADITLGKAAAFTAAKDVAAANIAIAEAAVAAVAGNVQAGAINVAGTLDVEKDVAAASLTVAESGNADIEGNVTVAAGANISGLTEIAGDMTSTAGDIAVLANKLDVEGKITAAANAVGVASGAALEAGAVEANSLTVNAEATATVAGNVDVIAGMNVAGTAAIAGNVTATLGSVQALGNGSISAADVTAVNVYVEADADLTAAGKVTAKDDVYVVGEMTAASVDAVDAVTVIGKADIEGAVNANTVDVVGTLEAGDVTTTAYVNVVGKADVAAIKAGWVYAGGELTADSITAAGVVNVAGAADVKGDVEAESLNVNADASLKVNNVSVDAFAIGGTIEISGNVDANKLAIENTAVINKGFYDITLGGHDVASTVAVEGADAVLTINKADVETGNINMIGTNSNSVAFNNAGINVNGKLDFAATDNNGLTTWADVTIAEDVEFSKSLIANINGKLTADINSAAYGEESADVADTLTITGTAAVIDGNINLNAGDDIIVANANFAAGTVDFGTGKDKLFGNGATIVAAVKSAEELTISNATIDGAVEADVLNVDVQATIDDAAGLKANVINLGSAALTVQNTYFWDDDSNPETPEVPKTDPADITAADTLKVTAQGGTINAGTINNAVEFTDSNVTVNADINGNVSVVETEDYAGTSSLVINGTITGAADLTAVETFGGNNEVKGGITFSQLTVAADSDITANITAAAPELNTSITLGTYENVTYYKWLGAFGPAGLGAYKKEDVVTTAYDNVALTLENDVTIIGNVTGSFAVDTITVGSDDRITGVLDFGTAAVNETTAGMDKLTSAAANTLSVEKVKFNGGLDINNVSLDRNVAMEDVKEQLEDAILAALGDSLTADVTTSAFSVEINGNTYGVAFELIDATLADDDPFKFDKSNIKVTVTGVDTTTVEGAGVLKVSSDITVNGSVKLSDADDVLTLNGSLTLNDIVIGDIATNYQYVITDAATGEGYWEAVGGSEKDAIVDGAKKEFDFGAGTDAIVMADGVVLTAAKVAFDSLNIVGAEGYTADAAINAALEGKAALNIKRANVTVNGNVSAASTIVDAAYFTVNGDLSSDVTVNADGFKVVGAITGDVILNNAFDSSLTSVINGNVTLNQAFTFTADDPETIADETAAAAAGITQGDLRFGEGTWSVTNAAVVNGTANAAGDSGFNSKNSITNIYGAQDDASANVTSLTIAGAADIAGADASVNAYGELLIGGGIWGVKELTLNGKVNAAAASNIDSLIVNGANTIAAASGIDAITVNKDAVLNGAIAFTEMSVTGEGNVAATLTGTVAQDKLTLNGANVQIVNFAGSADTAVDTLTLEGANTAASVYFSGYGAIEGAGTLTGSVEIAGVGELTIGSAITGNVTGAAGVELIANAAISGTASGFGSYTGTGSVSNIAIDGAANVALQATTGIAGSANDDVLTLSANAGAIDLAAGADTLVIGAAVKAASLAGVETIAFDLSAAVAAGTTLLDLTTELSAADAAAATLDLSALTKEDFAGLAAGDDVVTLFKSAAAVSNDTAIAGWSLTLDGGLTATCEYDTTLKAYTITIA